MRWAGYVVYVGGRGEVHRGFWWGKVKERGHLEGPGGDGRILFRWILRKCDVGVWAGSIWLRIGACGGHL